MKTTTNRREKQMSLSQPAKEKLLYVFIRLILTITVNVIVINILIDTYLTPSSIVEKVLVVFIVSFVISVTVTFVSIGAVSMRYSTSDVQRFAEIDESRVRYFSMTLLNSLFSAIIFSGGMFPLLYGFYGHSDIGVYLVMLGLFYGLSIAAAYGITTYIANTRNIYKENHKKTHSGRELD